MINVPPIFGWGFFSDLAFWNPNNRDFNKLKPEERPMVDAGQVAFSGKRWTHIGLVFEGVNAEEKNAHCKLYIDGKLIGDLNRKQKFSWEPSQAFMMLGIYYVGQMDDFAVFDIALTEKQVQSLVHSKNSVSSLVAK